MLDLQQINLLSNDSKGKYMALERLFDSPGYKFLVAWAKASADECVVKILHAPNWDQHVAHTGAKYAYEQIINFEDITAQEFATEAETNRLFNERMREEAELADALDNE